jgi:hypothetical protein
MTDSIKHYRNLAIAAAIFLLLLYGLLRIMVGPDAWKVLVVVVTAPFVYYGLIWWRNKRVAKVAAEMNLEFKPEFLALPGEVHVGRSGTDGYFLSGRDVESSYRVYQHAYRTSRHQTVSTTHVHGILFEITDRQLPKLTLQKKTITGGILRTMVFGARAVLKLPDNQLSLPKELADDFYAYADDTNTASELLGDQTLVEAIRSNFDRGELRIGSRYVCFERYGKQKISKAAIESTIARGRTLRDAFLRASD